jgi:hypothetical protein
MGSTDPVHGGALLELRTNGQAGGLLLPEVELTSATVWAPVAGSETNGMTVYNSHNTTQNGLAGEGVYVWTNGRWNLTASLPCTSSPQTPVLAVNGLGTGNKIDAFKPFLAYVSNPEPGVSYEWTLPAGLIGYSNTNVITIVGSKAGTHTMKVKATNECGSSNEASYSVTISILPTTVDGSGNVIIQGITCYDIAQIYRSPACGALNTRPKAFPNAGSRTRTYTVSIQDNTSLYNLRVGWMDDADNIIKSVSGDVSGPLNLNEYTITVVFADNINDIVKDKADYKSTAKLYVVFRAGSVEKYVALTITVQDCACCPLTVAYIIEDAAYKGADIIKVGSSSAMNHFTRIPNAALCVWKRDQGNPVSANVGNNWVDANRKCTQIMKNDGYGDDWRLPNIAEMYHKLHRAFFTDGGGGTSIYKQVSRYLSNTAQAGAGNREKMYLTSMKEVATVRVDGGTISRSVGSTANFRCVKTINR